MRRAAPCSVHLRYTCARCLILAKLFARIDTSPLTIRRQPERTFRQVELSLQGAWIGVNHQRIFIRTAKGETVTLALDEAESLMHGLSDAIQTADHLPSDAEQTEMPVKVGGIFQDIENLIAACEGRPAA